jgi:predicted dehydrogenase
MMGLRVGIVGARRRRQGLGPYVARELVRAGASIPCILGTTRASVEVARRELVETLHLDPRGFVDIDEMLASEPLDALAILSPPESHAMYLEAALAAGLHVFCEKPFLWGGPELGARARRLVAEFAERGLVVRENCQWPFTLPAYEKLFPGVLARPPELFAMSLSPPSGGRRMLPDALPHALSLLQAIVPSPDPAIEEIRFSTADPDAAEILVSFRYRAGPTRVRTEVRLVHGPTQPRAATYGLDGRLAWREVRMSDYRLWLHSETDRVALEDPLGRAVVEFLAAIPRSSEPSDAIAQRLQLLVEILTAFDKREGVA